MRWLLLPMARNALLQAVLITLVLTLNNFAVPAILQTKVFLEEVWVTFNTKLDTAKALQLSLPLVLIPLALLFWFRRQTFGWPNKQNAVSAKLFRQQVGKKFFSSAGVVTLLAIFFSVARTRASEGVKPPTRSVSRKRNSTRVGSVPFVRKWASA